MRRLTWILWACVVVVLALVPAGGSSFAQGRVDIRVVSSRPDKACSFNARVRCHGTHLPNPIVDFFLRRSR